MELELGLALPNTASLIIKEFDLNTDIAFPKKRTFGKAFLFEDGDDGGHDECNIKLDDPLGLNKLETALIGWPPIKCRKKVDGRGENDGVRRNNKLVKVKMEGVAIGRKLDLSLLDSYQALRCKISRMFPDRSPDQHDHVVTYEDEEGDRMLVGDVPWATFVRSVKRLKILGDRSN